jgi:hypothetical protein
MVRAAPRRSVWGRATDVTLDRRLQAHAPDQVGLLTTRRRVVIQPARVDATMAGLAAVRTSSTRLPQILIGRAMSRSTPPPACGPRSADQVSLPAACRRVGVHPAGAGRGHQGRLGGGQGIQYPGTVARSTRRHGHWAGTDGVILSQEATRDGLYGIAQVCRVGGLCRVLPPPPATWARSRGPARPLGGPAVWAYTQPARGEGTAARSAAVRASGNPRTVARSTRRHGYWAGAHGMVLRQEAACDGLYGVA